MKIVSIFAEKLFAFHYADEAENELKRLLNQWNDVAYLYQFLKENEQDVKSNSELKSTSIETLINQIVTDANRIDDLLKILSSNETKKLDSFFKSLHNSEYQFQTLSLQKGRKNYLRIYALRIDENCFVITGGAIKFHHLMQERVHTNIELQKLEKAKQFLKANDVFDTDSFYEFIIELL